MKGGIYMNNTSRHMKRYNKNTTNIKRSNSKALSELSLENALYFLFLIAIGIGVVFANLTSIEKRSEIEMLLDILKTSTIVQSFVLIVFKYMKYHVLILVGAFIPNGIFLSLVVFIFRGIVVGYTGGIMIVIFGIGSGVLEIFDTFFFPNLFFIPAYFFAMYFAIEEYFRMSNKNLRCINKNKNFRKDSRHKLYLSISILLIFFGCIVEKFICG